MVNISRRFRPLWMERRWQQRAGCYFFGWYRVPPYGAWQGRIIRRHATRWSYFICNPPEEVLSGPHGACFLSKGNGVYEVHFSLRATSLDDGILAIEQTIRESIEQQP